MAKRKATANELALLNAPEPTKRKATPEELAQLNEPPPVDPHAFEKSPLGTIAHGAYQGATYGFGDELQGVLGAGIEGAKMIGRKVGALEPLDENDDVFAGTNPATGAGVGERLATAYRQTRDEERRDAEIGATENPKLATAAELGGVLLAPGPKGVAAKGALARAQQMGRFGLKAGAAAGAGGSKADLTDGNMGDFLLDTAGGAALGFGGGATIGALSAKLQPYLRKVAEKASFRSLNPRVAMGKGDKLQELAAKSPVDDPLQAARELGRRALDEGITVLGGSSEGAAKRAGTKLGESGTMQGAFLQSVQDANPAARVSQPAVARALEQQAADAEKSSARQAFAAYLRNQAKTQRAASLNRLEAGGSGLLTLTEAEAEKRALQEAVRKASKNYLAKGDKLDAMRKAASEMRQGVESAIERSAGPEDLAQFQALKQRTGQLADINDVASYGAAREMRLDGGGVSELADAIGRRTGSNHTPVIDPRWWVDHVKDVLGRTARERAPATKAVAVDFLSRRNLAPNATRATLDEYLRFLNEEKDTQ